MQLNFNFNLFCLFVRGRVGLIIKTYFVNHNKDSCRILCKENLKNVNLNYLDDVEHIQAKPLNCSGVT